MSLVIMVGSPRGVFAASDGRALCHGQIASNTESKLFRTRSGQIVGITGNSALGRPIRQFVMDFDGTFSELADGLKARIANCAPVGVVGVIAMDFERKLYLSLDNGKLSKREAGPAETVVFAHGWIRHLTAELDSVTADAPDMREHLFSVIQRAEQRFPREIGGLYFYEELIPDGLETVADGTSFARLKAAQLTSNTLGANSSYRPTSNPLTATDAGSSATVNIAAWTNQVSGIGAVSYNGGSITGLSYNTLYYVYAPDPTLSGGAVSYNYTTTKSNIVSGIGNFYVGSILTPPATGATTIGNNDGGTGAQIGLQGNVWGTAISYSGTGSSAAWVNPTNAIDGNTSTDAYINSASAITRMTLSGFNGIAPVYTSITLNVRTQITGSVGIPLTLDYSTDGGNTFTTIYSVTGGSRALTTDTITLPVTQSLALVQVRFTWGGAGTSSGQWSIYGAWLALSS